jgi:hypothetical protein
MKAPVMRLSFVTGEIKSAVLGAFLLFIRPNHC